MAFRISLNRPLLAIGTVHRSISTITRVQAAPSAKRTLAQPLAFVSVQGWDKQGLDGWKRWTELFSMQGYESQLVTLDPHPVPDSHSGTTEEMLAALEADLSRLISSGGSPFPPVLFASSLSTLVAETYVSSHPLQGLFLHAPALPLALPSSSVSTLPTILKSDFTYEPNFPLAVMAHVQKELERGRLWDEFGEGEDEDDRLVEFIVGRRDDEGFEKALEWMDASGI